MQITILELILSLGNAFGESCTVSQVHEEAKKPNKSKLLQEVERLGVFLYSTESPSHNHCLASLIELVEKNYYTNTDDDFCNTKIFRNLMQFFFNLGLASGCAFTKQDLYESNGSRIDNYLFDSILRDIKTSRLTIEFDVNNLIEYLVKDVSLEDKKHIEINKVRKFANAFCV
ncbi:MAG: hypothetical protein U9N57_01045 [Pseudomonadota bacterium]|nr:hypothetical protein [Pseudomonadota bacterium]